MPLQPTIAVDFDGTIVDFRFPAVGDIKSGVVEALQRFRDLGYHILIYSCRTSKWHSELFAEDDGQPVMERPTVKSMMHYLDWHGVPYDEVDDGSKGKPLADFYIDDKGVRFENNWPEIVKFVEGHR